MMEVAASSHDGFGSSLPQILLGGVENEGVSYRFIGRDNSPTPSPRPSPSVSRKKRKTKNRSNDSRSCSEETLVKPSLYYNPYEESLLFPPFLGSSYYQKGKIMSSIELNGNGAEMEEEVGVARMDSIRNSSPVSFGDALFDEKDYQEMGGDSRSSSPAPFYTLTVHLLKGSNLVIKDKNGLSDPFVKVKVGEKTLYKSKVVYANLNPVWDEIFTIPIHDITQPLIFKVLDYDWGSKDDFMGMCITNLRHVLKHGEPKNVVLKLSKKGLAGEKSMGEISASFILKEKSEHERYLWATESINSQAQLKMQKQTWNGSLHVLLVDIDNLAGSSNARVGDNEGQGSPSYVSVFAKLRLGNQKRRSKTVTESTDNLEWLEQFDFYLYDGSWQTTIFEVEFIEDAPVGRIPLGSASYDISGMERDKTTEFFLNFTNGRGRAKMALTISGFRPTPAEYFQESKQEALLKKYSLQNSFNLEEIRDVGHLAVNVIQAEGLRAADIGGKSDPFVVLELINARVWTHTEYKTLSPTWNKTFYFKVLDIASKLEVTVFDEDRDHKCDFLGKINIPLWKIQNGERIWYKLKNVNLAKGARGNNPQILLQMYLIWNPIRAAIRVTDPQEVKYSQPKPQLKIETFLVNMERLRLVLMDICDIWLYIKSCLDWEYPDRSIKALTTYLLICYYFQPFFIPLLCLIYWLRPWWHQKTSMESRRERRTTGTGQSSSGVAVNAAAEDTLNLDESDGDDAEEIKKLSLCGKFTILQDASGVLQELVGEIAGIGESAVNTYRMVVPFIYWLFALFFALTTVLLLFIDFRYVAMLFGIHEFSRIYLRPWKQSSFEIYHMIRRVPHQMNMGDKLGINSVLKSIQQLKQSKNKRFWRGKSPSPCSPSPPNGRASSWYVEPEEDE